MQIPVLALVLQFRYNNCFRLHGDLRMSDIHLVAKEIEQYLTNHPHAADSIEGIIKWWLPQQRYVDAHDKIARALDYLISRGVVKKIDIPGSVLYSCNEIEATKQDKEPANRPKG